MEFATRGISVIRGWLGEVLAWNETISAWNVEGLNNAIIAFTCYLLVRSVWYDGIFSSLLVWNVDADGSTAYIAMGCRRLANSNLPRFVGKLSTNCSSNNELVLLHAEQFSFSIFTRSVFFFYVQVLGTCGKRFLKIFSLKRYLAWFFFVFLSFLIVWTSNLCHLPHKQTVNFSRRISFAGAVRVAPSINL